MASEAYAELHAAGIDTKDELREALSQPSLDAFARIGDAACRTANFNRLNSAANYHDIIEVPYSEYPPDFPFYKLRRGLGKEAIDAVLCEFWPPHEEHNISTVGPTDDSFLHKSELVSNWRTDLQARDGQADIDSGLIALYMRTHKQEHDRDFCVTPLLAAQVGRSIHSNHPVYKRERKVIDEYLTFRYPTSLVLATGINNRLGGYLRLPLASGEYVDTEYAKKRLQAVGVIIACLEQDEILAADMKAVVEKHSKLICDRTLRSKDEPYDLAQSTIHNLAESVGRAVLPLQSEMLRGGFERDAPRAHQAMVQAGIMAKLTSLASVGYAGPVGVRGVGMTRPPVEADVDDLNWRDSLRIAPYAVNDFVATREIWTNEYHHPLLLKHLEALQQGDVDVTPDERTGLGCAFPKVALEADRLIATLASIIAPGRWMNDSISGSEDRYEYIPSNSSLSFSKSNPYRPRNVFPLVKHIVDQYHR